LEQINDILHSLIDRLVNGIMITLDMTMKTPLTQLVNETFEGAHQALDAVAVQAELSRLPFFSVTMTLFRNSLPFDSGVTNLDALSY